jgi:hypothetical protein
MNSPAAARRRGDGARTLINIDVRSGHEVRLPDLRARPPLIRTQRAPITAVARAA